MLEARSSLWLTVHYTLFDGYVYFACFNRKGTFDIVSIASLKRLVMIYKDVLR